MPYGWFTSDFLPAAPPKIGRSKKHRSKAKAGRKANRARRR